MADPRLKFGGIRSGGSEVMALKQWQCAFPEFLAPPNGKTMPRIQKVRTNKMVRVSSITMTSMVVLGLHMLPRGERVRCFCTFFSFIILKSSDCVES